MRTYYTNGCIYYVEKVVAGVEIIELNSEPHIRRKLGVLGFFDPFEIACSAVGFGDSRVLEYVDASTRQQIPIKDLPSRLDKIGRVGRRMVLRAVDRDGRFEAAREDGASDIVTSRIHRISLID